MGVSDITKVCSNLSMCGKLVQCSKVEILLPTFFIWSLYNYSFWSFTKAV